MNPTARAGVDGQPLPHTDRAVAPRTGRSGTDASAPTRGGILAGAAPVAAWGAALVAAALGAGALTSPSSGFAARAVALFLLALAAAALAWGAASLAAGRLVTPRLAIAGSLTGIAGIGATATIRAGEISFVPAAGGLVLLLAVGAGAAIASRRPQPASPRANLAATMLAAVLVGGIATPALGTTEAGEGAPDHSEHGTVLIDPPLIDTEHGGHG